MSESIAHTDGNAIAGALSSIFSAEVTETVALCAHCGADEPVARQLLFSRGPGAVLRCVHCEGVLLRLVETPRERLLDVSGISRLVITVKPAQPASI